MCNAKRSPLVQLETAICDLYDLQEDVEDKERKVYECLKASGLSEEDVEEIDNLLDYKLSYMTEKAAEIVSDAIANEPT